MTEGIDILRMAVVGPAELILILIIAVLIFGADKLADLGSALGKGIKEFRSAVRDVEAEEEGPESA